MKKVTIDRVKAALVTAGLEIVGEITTQEHTGIIEVSLGSGHTLWVCPGDGKATVMLGDKVIQKLNSLAEAINFIKASTQPSALSASERDEMLLKRAAEEARAALKKEGIKVEKSTFDLARLELGLKLEGELTLLIQGTAPSSFSVHREGEPGSVGFGTIAEAVAYAKQRINEEHLVHA